ncbi:hypothetical protein PHET_09152 [Paragonimus heterotremus]|uniref:Uncharacterized protein n=1 Tax=Paragonimus heterotremus TaxID=100268 RepID=A0A8J4STJ8_9TREM|nr:hypothetical protein PHET_09152 [Paragonimus heterotremus]
MRPETMNPPLGFPKWFDMDSFVICVQFLSWLLIFLMTFEEARIFTFVLCFLSPITVLLLVAVVVTFGLDYANSTGQLRNFLTRFYTGFSTRIPVEQYARDQFQIQPLFWGFLVTFVHLSQSSNLWNGVFPILGRWAGGVSTKRHTGWIPLVIGWALLAPLPTLLMVFAVSSSYDTTYLRCHLGVDWMTPFVIVPHVLSKFSSHRCLAVAYFSALALSLLLTQSLLILTTVGNILDVFVSSSTSQQSVRMKHRISVLVLIPLFCLLGLPLLQRTGFYWIRLVDAYLDRLLVITATLQAVGYIVVYARSQMFHNRRQIRMLLLGTVYGILSVVGFVSPKFVTGACLED